MLGQMSSVGLVFNTPTPTERTRVSMLATLLGIQVTTLDLPCERTVIVKTGPEEVDGQAFVDLLNEEFPNLGKVKFVGYTR